MKRERLEQIEGIYQAVIDQPLDRRAAFLLDSCGDDDDLLREVESLLIYDTLDSHFIDSSPDQLIVEMFQSEDENSAPAYSEISHYKVERKLGEGGMGEVFLAEDLRLHRLVALKILPQNIVGDADRLMRFEREARAASALNHPNILTVHEFGEDGGVHFIASEFVEGETLRNRLVKDQLDPTEALEIVIQVASALSAAHEAGITHRDIKPENIMIRPDGYVKVLDFGLAKIGQQEKSKSRAGSEDPTKALHNTEPGAVMGTDAYMSPEQARGLRVDSRTDIWSLGVVIYETLVGKRPFSGKTRADTIVSVLSSDPLTISSYGRNLPAEFDWIVSKALSKDVDGRYQTAKEFRADLAKMKSQIELDAKAAGQSPRARSIHSTIEVGLPTGLGEPINSTVETGHNSPITEQGMAATQESPPSGWFAATSAVSGIFRQTQSRVPFYVLCSTLLAFMSAAVYLFFFTPAVEQRIDSIAVLPFENTSGNADLTSVSDGMSEALIDRLSQLPQLKVISRNSSFKFRGTNIDQNEVASQLGVRAIVTGSVSQVGDELVIRVDIADAVENTHLTGLNLRRKAVDLPAIQSEIARTATEQLRLKLTSAQSKRLADNGTEDSEAYRYYLNGLVTQNGLPNARNRAIEYFERSVELDPNFAAAHVEIAWIYYLRANGSDDPAVLMPKAKAATDRALALDPNHAKGHVLNAMVSEYELDWRGAESEYKRSIDLSPNLDFARNNYAFHLSVMGRHDEALAQLEEQRLRDPINQRLALLHKGIVLVQARRFDDALQAYQQAQAVEADKDVPEFALGYAYDGKGLFNEAVTHYKKSITLLGGEDKYSQPLVYLAATYAKMPSKQLESRALLTKIEAMPEYKSPALLAIVYSALGNNDKAIELLEQAYIKRDPLLRFIGQAYEYDSLRNDPRFTDLIRRIGIG